MSAKTFERLLAFLKDLSPMKFKLITWLAIILIAVVAFLCALAIWLDRVKDFMLVASVALNIAYPAILRPKSE